MLAVLVLLAAPAQAAQLNVDIKTEAETNITDIEVDFEAPGLSMERSAANRFTYTFGDPRAVTSSLTLSIDPAPEQLAEFKLTFNAPFFWQQAEATRLAVALVPEALEARTASQIIQDGGSLSTLPARVLINQRARLAFRLLRQEFSPQSISSDDAMVALIFVRSSKELGYRDFVEPDDEMLDVADWLRGIVDDTQRASRLFPRSSDLENARETLRQFGLVSAMQDQVIVDAISKGVGSPSRVVKQDACQRAYGLNETFLSLVPSDDGATTGSQRREIQNLTNVAICKWRELPSQAGADTVLVEEAVAIRDQMVTILGAFTPDETDCGVVRFARARIGDLEQRLALQQVAPLNDDAWPPVATACERTE